ncbi:hypothetical protein ACFXKF_36390 [Streptomyces scopuliridis]|uniref:hypothetical protein n=1 Tax=Streptomyces scopuliridis TaxID=452529 RepID=UPI0036CA21A1
MLDIKPELDWQIGTRELVYLIKADDLAAGTETSYTFPLRPFEAHVTYRTRDGGYWRLDSVIINGRRVRRNGTVNPDAAPHAAHYVPGNPFYDDHAPQWLRDFVESHRTPPPLAQPV